MPSQGTHARDGGSGGSDGGGGRGGGGAEGGGYMARFDLLCANLAAFIVVLDEMPFRSRVSRWRTRQ